MRRSPSSPRPRVPSSRTPPLRFDQRLVLHQWILGLFGVQSLDDLARQEMRDPDCEGLDENNVSRFYHALTLRLFDRPELPKDLLLAYDENIVRHSQAINAKRRRPIRWKYFQYFSLLFTEIYLDRYFRVPQKLLDDLNQYVAVFNQGKRAADQVEEYQMADLSKLAFWKATGSGKTLVMHVNILQYRHFLQQAGREGELNRTILLTPNEGLSRQHLEEFAKSGIEAELFNKDGAGLFAGHAVEIIDIHKLRDTMGEKTVAIDAFEGNNLVLVDEGHRGAGGDEWMSKRTQLCAEGFSFEYSATFGQAMKAANNLGLQQEYAKCILFDYSYKWFYKDGFGKDYRILNLADDRDLDLRRLYLTACLTAFYQQQRLYHDREVEYRHYLLEAPLWVFVGGSVNAVRTQGGRKVSDVVDILLFLAEFAHDRAASVAALKRLLGGDTGLLDTKGRDIFANAFPYLAKQHLTPEQVYDDILDRLFNAKHSAALHVEDLKGADGEIALRLGDNDPFGVINVGDTSSLCKLCDEHEELVVADREFSGSLFGSLNDPRSSIHILIGSKKFTEGWNSWRVSTMGLMNIGRGEGSEIIQLFGRGVRLKGLDFCLKRSNRIDGVEPPRNIGLLETLNIFGIRADYMQQFREYLEEEGLPSNEERIEIILPVVKNLGTQKLKVIGVKGGLDFKRDGPKPALEPMAEHFQRYPVVLDWYPRIQARHSAGGGAPLDVAQKHPGKLTAEHLAFMDLDALYFELEAFKNERAWYNLNLPREAIGALLTSDGWYTLLIPPEELQFASFHSVTRWQEIASALLRRYADRYYKCRKADWEKDHLEYRELSPDDPNFIEQYRFMLDESQQEIADKLRALKAEIEVGHLAELKWGKLHAMVFDRHLYQPLVYLHSDLIEVSPVPLNEGERDFVLDLRSFHEAQTAFFADCELYLLRNQSKGKGIGFFEAGNFHPDFIMWLVTGGRQYVTFVDPKGLRNLWGPDDPKIQFYQTIKQIEARLGDPGIVLNSFIVSNTPYAQVSFWGKSRAELEACNVLFQEPGGGYVGRMLGAETIG